MISLENIIEICVAIDIAILGIAYPIIVDKASNIGEKFSSQYLSVVFNYEIPQRPIGIKFKKAEFKISIFKLFLFCTLVSFIFIIIKAEPPEEWDNWFINNSANIVVGVLSVCLTILFFWWLEKVILFNGKPTTLLSHIIKENNKLPLKVNSDKRTYYLKTINEFTYYSIEKQDEHLEETLLEFYYKTFGEIRRSSPKDKPLEYPVDLYFMVNRLNEYAIDSQNKKLKEIEHRAVSGVWLLGEDFEEIIISDETYRNLWRNIYTICDFPRFVKLFWAHSSQYYDYRLRLVLQDFAADGKVSNSAEVESRDKERQKFLEFHYALGGLMYYRGQYGVLKYFFEYTQSQPPKYVLLPHSMTDIFSWFEHFSNEYKNIGLPIDLKYYFPELDNLGNRRQVNYWICSYITILFIRQFSLVEYYVYQNLTAAPVLPTEITELRKWLDSLTFFEKCLKNVLENKKLFQVLGYNINNNNKDNLWKFVGDLKQAINDRIGEQKRNAEISQEMVEIFFKSSISILEEGFKAYDPVFIPLDQLHKSGSLKLTVTGSKTLMSKSAFTEGDIPHFNYDSIFAQALVRESIRRYIPNSFTVARTKRYLLVEGDLITGLNRLVGGDSEGFAIVGVNLHGPARKILEDSNFKNILLNIEATEYRAQDVLFVMRSSDLPAIEHRELGQEEIDELKLQLIHEKLKIYGSVIDINKEENREIKDKWHLENDPDNQELKVQVALGFLSIIHWKDNRQVIQININSEFREQGIPTNINDIVPLGNKAEG